MQAQLEYSTHQQVSIVFLLAVTLPVLRIVEQVVNYSVGRYVLVSVCLHVVFEPELACALAVGALVLADPVVL